MENKIHGRDGYPRHDTRTHARTHARTHVRTAIAIEAKAFLQRGDVARLPEPLRAPAKKIFDWWIEAVAKEVADADTCGVRLVLDVGGSRMASGVTNSDRGIQGRNVEV